MRRRAPGSITDTRPTAPRMMPWRWKRRSTRIAVSTVVPAASARVRRVRRASPSLAARNSSRASREGAPSWANARMRSCAAWSLGEQPQKRAAGERPGDDLAEALGARGIAVDLEGREGPEDLAGPERLERGHPPVGRALVEPHGALPDRPERLGWLPLDEQRGPRRQPALAHRGAHARQAVRAEGAEELRLLERDLADRGPRHLGSCYDTHHTGRGGRAIAKPGDARHGRAVERQSSADS